jgi:hypothetical protein
MCLRFLVRDQEVEGSNPFAPTNFFLYGPKTSFTVTYVSGRSLIRINDLRHTEIRRAPGMKPMRSFVKSIWTRALFLV